MEPAIVGVRLRGEPKPTALLQLQVFVQRHTHYLRVCFGDVTYRDTPTSLALWVSFLGRVNTSCVVYLTNIRRVRVTANNGKSLSGSNVP